MDGARLGESLGRARLFDGAVAVFLLGLPLVRIAGLRVELAQALWFGVGAFVLWGLSLMREPTTRWRSRPLGVALVLALVGLGWQAALTYPGAVVDRHFLLYALISGSLYLFAGLLLMTTVARYTTVSLLPWVAVALALGDLGVVIGEAWQSLWHYGLGWWGTFQPVGVWLTPSQHGFVSALLVPLCWSVSPRWAMVPLVTLLVSKTATPLMALGMVALTTAAVARRWLLVGVLVLVGVGAQAMTAHRVSERFDARLEALTHALQRIQSRPLLGYGWDTSLNAPMVSTDFGYTYPHNDYLSLAKSCGIPVLLLLVWGLGTLITASPPSPALFALGIAAITMLFQTQAWFPRTMGVVCVLLGLVAHSGASRVAE